MENFDPSDESGRQNMMEVFNNVGTYTVGDIENFANSEYIKKY